MCILWVQLSIRIISFEMNAKYRTDYFNKINQANSPYIQLLQAKKKIVKNQKVQPSKRSPCSTSMFITNQPYKSLSSEKVKISKSQATKKKRSQTEHQQKMHQSLYVDHEKEHAHQATKSLFQNQIGKDQSVSHYDFIVEKQKKTSAKKNKHKHKISSESLQNPHNASLTQLKITEIDSLVALIENCVEEANEYISYLSEKIEKLQNELTLSRNQTQKIIQSKNMMIVEKDVEIEKLRKELAGWETKGKSFQVKALLQIIQKLSNENQVLKKKVEEKLDQTKCETRKKNSKDFTNDLDHKIDFFNVSLQKTNVPGREGFVGLLENPKDTSDHNKKYKFIKPKHK